MTNPIKAITEWLNLPDWITEDLRLAKTKSGYLGTDSDGDLEDHVPADGIENALLVTSRHEDDAPAWIARGDDAARYSLLLDIDVPMIARTSSSGNTHLFFDVSMTRKQHDNILDALAKGGVIERGFAASAKSRTLGASLRLPWVQKGEDLTLAQLSGLEDERQQEREKALAAALAAPLNLDDLDIDDDELVF